MQRLGWPGFWNDGHLYGDDGLPVHLYPFPVTADGRGPCDTTDPAYDHDICWCHFDDCRGIENDFGFPMILVKALGWFRITGRGTMVEVDMRDADARGDGVRRGDHVQFELSRGYSDADRSDLITADRIYEVLSIEESRCLVNHGPGSKQCVMGRGLMVREVR